MATKPKPVSLIDPYGDEDGPVVEDTASAVEFASTEYFSELERKHLARREPALNQGLGQPMLGAGMNNSALSKKKRTVVKSMEDLAAMVGESYIRREVDEYGHRETARVFFDRVWRPLLKDYIIFGDDLRRVDYPLYQALVKALSRANSSLKSVGLEPSPTRGQLGHVRSDAEREAHRKAKSRERQLRHRLKHSMAGNAPR